ncbi:hypothetical protein FHX42_000761 [Saccharopolyspora lacisalsi]|uniref:Uncharacterized protein n=1 Tax=Halosaccharopolyspora lacisalsi TaxID=1000566 RepID=A0A839DN92_9PSEU|nr:hypothetical protein [Halosaccharopolyspora lacisalsi]
MEGRPVVLGVPSGAAGAGRHAAPTAEVVERLDKRGRLTQLDSTAEDVRESCDEKLARGVETSGVDVIVP